MGGLLTYTGNGRQTKYIVQQYSNVHGTLMVGGSVALWGIKERTKKRIKNWYKRHQLYIWYWLVFSVWITLGAMVGLMFYAVMPQ